MTEAWAGDGVMINSGPFNGHARAARDEGQSVKAVIAWLRAAGHRQRQRSTTACATG